MTRTIEDISVSLGGLGHRPRQRPGRRRGGPAHLGVSDDPGDRRVLREATARSGAVVRDRRVFDAADGPKGWNDDAGYGAAEAGKPAFVVTSSPPEPVRLTGRDWTVITTGRPGAVTAARERAEAASSECERATGARH